jgi:hypothetical protein
MAEIMIVTSLFVTRIVLPVAATLLLGAWIERRLNRNTHS